MAQRPNVEYIRFQTCGSSALKPEPVVRRKSAPKAAPRKARRIKLFVDPVAVLSIFVAVCMLATVLTGFARLDQACRERDAMAEYVQELEAEQATLRHRYESGYDLEAVRRTALALDMISAEEAPRISVEIPAETEEVPQLTLWERLGTFLTGLFA